MHRKISHQENVTFAPPPPPTPDWLTPDSLLSPKRVYGRAYADVTTKISRMDVDLPTSGLKFFSRARSGSGRFF